MIVLNKQLSNVGVLLGAGTATIPPIQLTSGTNLTSAVAGAEEYDGVNTYITNDTTSGRARIPLEQRFMLTAAGSTISTIANYFGTTSNIPLISGAYYEIEIFMFFLKTTASTVVFTLTNSAAQTAMNVFGDFSPITGITSTPTAGLNVQLYDSVTAAQTITTGSLTTLVNHFAHLRIWLHNGTGTSLKIQATATSGSITPGIGSFWTSQRIAPNNIGAFAT